MIRKIIKLGVLALWLTLLFNTIVSCNVQIRTNNPNGFFLNESTTQL